MRADAGAPGDISAESAEGETHFVLDGNDVRVEDSGALETCLRVGALCNTATLGAEAEDAETGGDPMEQALLVTAVSRQRLWDL